MAQAFVTPNLVLWARERRGLDREEVARQMSVKADAVNSWEEGSARPTFRQAQRLANRLKIPFGYLFLASPPEQKLPIPDLRTFAAEPSRAPSPEFLDLLNDVLNKQQWFREFQESEGAEPLPFIGRFELGESVDDIAEDIQTTLRIDDQMRQAAGNWEAFLRQFIRRVEDAGILILRNGVVANNPHRPLNVAEFRGFAISDDIAPPIFINGRDYKAAQIFTVAHEIAHLWIGESGISNPDYRLSSAEQTNNIERICNRVAAETLVPSVDFRTRWRNGKSTLEANLEMLASWYRVSQMVVLRQAYDLGLIQRDTYWEHYDGLISRQAAKETVQASEGGGNFYATLLARNGKNFTSSVLISVAEGSLLYNEAARLLNVRVKTLGGVAEFLFGNSLAIG